MIYPDILTRYSLTYQGSEGGGNAEGNSMDPGMDARGNPKSQGHGPAGKAKGSSPASEFGGVGSSGGPAVDDGSTVGPAIDPNAEEGESFGDMFESAVKFAATPALAHLAPTVGEFFEDTADYFGVELGPSYDGSGGEKGGEANEERALQRKAEQERQAALKEQSRPRPKVLESPEFLRRRKDKPAPLFSQGYIDLEDY